MTGARRALQRRRGTVPVAMLVVVALAFGFASFFAPGEAEACATCLGDPDSAATKGMNNAILTLLGVVATVQVGFVALFWQVRRRAKSFREHRDGFHLIDGGLR